MSMNTFARAAASLSARSRMAASGSSALGMPSARWIAWSSSRSMPVSSQIWRAETTGRHRRRCGPQAGASARRRPDLVDGETLLQQPLDEFCPFGARLSFEAVEQAAFDVDVFGHGPNVYRHLGAVFAYVTTPLLHGLPPIIDDGAHP